MIVFVCGGSGGVGNCGIHVVGAVVTCCYKTSVVKLKTRCCPSIFELERVDIPTYKKDKDNKKTNIYDFSSYIKIEKVFTNFSLLSSQQSQEKIFAYIIK